MLVRLLSIFNGSPLPFDGQCYVAGLVFEPSVNFLDGQVGQIVRIDQTGLGKGSLHLFGGHSLSPTEARHANQNTLKSANKSAPPRFHQKQKISHSLPSPKQPHTRPVLLPTIIPNLQHNSQKIKHHHMLCRSLFDKSFYEDGKLFFFLEKILDLPTILQGSSALFQSDNILPWQVGDTFVQVLHRQLLQLLILDEFALGS